MSASVVVFSIGLVFTMATQLRLAGLPVGPGEALLLAWACISWVDLVGRRDLRIPADIRPFALFFAFIVALLLISALYQILRTRDLSDNALRDVAAYVFTAALVLTFGCLRPSKEYVLISIKIVTIGVILSLGILLIINQFTQTLGPILLHDGWRFYGWANNPNQIGMALTPIPFLCLFLLRQATTAFGRVFWCIFLAASLTVGIATGSDASRLGWIVGTVMLLLLALLTKVAGRQHPLLTIANLFAVLVLGLLIAIATPIGSTLFERIAEGDQGNHRTTLWLGALSRIFESPILGVGPGDQSLEEMGVAFEAHNSYLDLALGTGLLGVGAAIWLSVSLMLRPSLVARPTLWSALMALQCFAAFHYIFRHPLYWFYLILLTSFAYRDYTKGVRSYPANRVGAGDVEPAAAAAQGRRLLQRSVD